MSKIEEIDKLIKAGAEFQGIQLEQNEVVRKESKAVYGQLNTAYILATGIIAELVTSRVGEAAKTNEDISRSLALTASFIQGMGLTEDAISEGFYVQATALLKQELETLARIAEVRVGVAKDGSTPNVKHVAFGLKTTYGDFNRIAHVAQHDALSWLVALPKIDELLPVSLTARFQDEIAQELYARHVTHLLILFSEITILYEEMYALKLSEEHAKYACIAFDILKKEGYLIENKASK